MMAANITYTTGMTESTTAQQMMPSTLETYGELWSDIQQNVTEAVMYSYMDNARSRPPFRPAGGKKSPGKPNTSPPKILGLTVLVILNVLMITGNLVSIITIILNINLRSTTYYKNVLSLASADFLIGAIIMPIYIFWEYNYVWPFDHLSCKVITSIDIGLTDVSTYTLVLIALDKFIYISKPLSYKRLMTPCLCAVLISSVWIIWLPLGFVTGFGGIAQNSKFKKKKLLDDCVFIMSSLYTILMALLTFAVPFTLMLFFSVKMYNIARRHLKQLDLTTVRSDISRNDSNSDTSQQQGRLGLEVNRSTQVMSTISGNTDISVTLNSLNPIQNDISTITNIPSDSNVSTNRTRRSSARKRKTKRCKPIRTLSVVILFFFVMCAPYWIATVADVFCECVPYWIYEDILTVIYKLNSLVNPFIYISTDKKFKATVKKTLRRLCFMKCCKSTRTINVNTE